MITVPDALSAVRLCFSALLENLGRTLSSALPGARLTSSSKIEPVSPLNCFGIRCGFITSL